MRYVRTPTSNLQCPPIVRYQIPHPASIKPKTKDPGGFQFTTEYGINPLGHPLSDQFSNDFQEVQQNFINYPLPFLLSKVPYIHMVQTSNSG